MCVLKPIRRRRYQQSETRARWMRPILMGVVLLVSVTCASAQSIDFFSPFTEYTQNSVTYGQGIVADATGNVYVSGVNVLAYIPVAANGTLETQNAYRIDNIGTRVYGLAIDSANNLYRPDITALNVAMYTLNGVVGGEPSYTRSTIGSGWTCPSSIATDSNFNVYVLDAGPGSIVELSPNGSGGFTQTTIYTDSRLIGTAGLSRDSSGNFYIASGPSNSALPSNCTENSTVAVYKVAPSGSTYTTTSLGSGWSSPAATAVDSVGNVWVTDYTAQKIFLLQPSGSSYNQIQYQSISYVRTLTVSKTGVVYGFTAGAGFGGSAAEIWAGGSAPHYLGELPLSTPTTVPVTVSYQVPVTSNYQVVTEGSASSDVSDAGTGTCAQNNSYIAGDTCTVNVEFNPSAPGLRLGALVVTDSSGVIGTNYFYGVGQGPVAAIIPGFMSTYAGTGAPCLGTGAACGDGGLATAALLSDAKAVATDSVGDVYIADYGSNLVRMIAPGGAISTVAGNGTPCSTPSGACGDGSAATSANLSPTGIALDGAGNLYIADYSADRIRMIVAGTGIITTAAGTGATCSSPTAACGDGGAATSAQLALTSTTGIAVDGFGNLLIADGGDNRIRSVASLTGDIFTIGGTGTACSPSTATCGDGGQATNASLNNPSGLDLDSQGDYLIADSGDHRIRKISALTSDISTVAGSGTQCTSYPCGDGGVATSANLNAPVGVSVDPAGNIYIGDTGDNTIRMVGTTGNISTIAGMNSTACSTAMASCGDGGAATSANLNAPSGIALDGSGNLYIADSNTNRVRQVNVSSTGTIAFDTTTTNSTSNDSPKSITLSNIGNAALTISVPSTGTNPSFAAGFVSDSSTTCPVLTTTSSAGSLAAGSSCSLAIDFQPTTLGTNSGNAIYTDNSLTVAGSMQTIPLTGTATGPVSQVVLHTSIPPTTLGGNAGSVTVWEEDSNGNTVVSASDTVTLTVSGPNGYSAIYTTAAVNGVATFNLSAYPLTQAGTYTYTASIATNSSVTPSSVNQTVAKATPTVQLSSSPNPAVQNSPITLTATVSSSVSTPTGTVSFYDGTTLLGSAVPLSNGTASLTTSALPTGADSITAVYSGDSSFQQVTSSPLSETVNQTTKATPTVQVTSSPNPATLANPTTFTVTVSSTSGSPTGTVSFYDGTTLLGGPITLSGGTASFTATTLPAGVNSITAVYSGNSSFQSVTSTAITETVADFSLSVSAASGSSATVKPGTTATFRLVVSPLAPATTFPAVINFSATGLPPGATYTLTPSSLLADSGSTNVTLAVSTASSSLTANRRVKMIGTGVTPLLGMLLLFFSYNVRRKGQRMAPIFCTLLLMASAAIFMGLVGCGYSTGFSGQGSATYTIAVTGTSGALSHSTNVTLDLQ
jgi:Bacterial Ig-like domain (group 3)/NHL repeat